ncbi:HET-domain-containing protein, partial [Bimuria novae-zelandiae CBS 107.79]
DMLLSCAQHHSDCQKTTHEFPIRARVIDCRLRRLVPLELQYRYAALSYVWGRRRPDHSPVTMHPGISEGFLPADLPLTIDDAMKTIRLIGLRYLWVDRYCIEQYHSADKEHQINRMFNIYNRAVITICAIGSHDDVGLPGISAGRDPPGIFHFHNRSYTVISAPGLLQQSLKKSVWPSRRWTFQEALLSRRCLILTEGEAFVICGS